MSSALFPGGGQMGELLNKYDWASHPLGHPQHWPKSLLTGVRMMLLSGYPMFIWWSKQLYMFHNDAYAPTFLGRHGEVLGAKAREAWADVWGQLGGVVEDILLNGTTFYAEDMLVVPQRKGFKEETYWTFSYSPMPDDEGRVNGIFCACSDVTGKVLSQRRLDTLHQLEQGSLTRQSVEQVSGHTLEVLEQQPADLPFAALYLLDQTGKVAQLQGQTRAAPNLPATPELPAALVERWLSGQEIHPAGIYQQLGLQNPADGSRHDPNPLDHASGQAARSASPSLPRAVVLPLISQHQLLGFLVAGVSPMLEYDSTYKRFHQLLARQLTRALEGVLARQQEQAQAQALEAERNRLYALFEQAPVAITILEGESYVVRLANPSILEIWAKTKDQVQGMALFEAMPEFQHQGLEELLAGVRTSGKPYVGQQLPMQLNRNGKRETAYFNFVYHPLREPQGAIHSIAVVATEVTELVSSRQTVEKSARQLQSLNEVLTTANKEIGAANKELQAAQEEIRTSNEELQASNEELQRARGALEQLNAQLEARIVQRTLQLQQAQQEAGRQKDRLERFFQQTPAAICVLDGEELVFELVNPYFQQLYPGRELLGKSLQEALPEIAGGPFYAILKKVYQTGDTFEGKEVPFPMARYPGGPVEDLYFNFIYQARLNEQGLVDGILAFGNEVTGQALAHKEVEKHARQLKLITDAVPVLISYVDKAKKYQFANYAYQEWFLQQPEALLGRYVWEVIGEKAYQGVKGYIDRALAGERVDFEAKMPYREGFVKYIRTSYVPDRREGEVAGFYALVSDVTEQVLAREQVEESEKKLFTLNQELAAINEELRVANEEVQAANEELNESNHQLMRINQDLERTNQDLDNFVYTASHDLKAPILNIEGLLRALEKQLRREEPRQETFGPLFEFLYGSVSRFKTTIGDLTQVATISKENPEDVVNVQIGELLEEVLQDLEPQIQQAAARVEQQLECPSIAFSKKNLKSILYNLLSNALKYRSPDRQLTINITCQTQGDFQVLTVEDNGIGMDMRQEEKIFALFKRLHTHVEGTGIGLYMVKRMIENAGGKIEVKSQVNVGSTFKVFFR